MLLPPASPRDFPAGLAVEVFHIRLTAIHTAEVELRCEEHLQHVQAPVDLGTGACGIDRFGHQFDTLAHVGRFVAESHRSDQDCAPGRCRYDRL